MIRGPVSNTTRTLIIVQLSLCLLINAIFMSIEYGTLNGAPCQG